MAPLELLTIIVLGFFSYLITSNLIRNKSRNKYNDIWDPKPPKEKEEEYKI